MKKFIHTGDIGDIIAGLPVMRALGGGELIIRNHPQCGTEPRYRAMEGASFEALRPLLIQQDYIEKMRFDPKARGNYDFTHFRTRYHANKSLTQAQADYFGVKNPCLSPWLKVNPSPESAGKVVVARSARYHNRRFPWREMNGLASRMLFVGLPEEHRVFQEYAGFAVTYRPTKDFLELAELIAGSEFFMGNQSSPCWVAMGLGQRLMQETTIGNPDSRIERSNAQFVRDGKVIIP